MTHEIPQEVIEKVARVITTGRDPARLKLAKAAIQAAIESGYVVVNQWMPIETAPKQGKILVYRPLAHLTGDPHRAIKRATHNVNFCFENTIPSGYCKNQHFNDGAAFATHWMHLPHSPTKGDK